MNSVRNPVTLFELGRAHRRHMGRAAHAVCPTKRREADPIELIEASMRGRVPELIPLKYERMAESPFGFFRGAVPVMAYDFSLGQNSGIETQLCGDAHVRNLGAFAAPDGRLVFDINDFDETTGGPFEWDVKRMAASILLAAHESGGDGSAMEAAQTFVASYRSWIMRFSQMALLDVARHQVHRLRSLKPLAAILRVAERATPLHSLELLTEPPPPGAAHLEHLPAPARVFRTAPPEIRRVPGEEARQVLHALGEYAASLLPERERLLAKYTPVDVGFKVVGTGSVGLRDYCIYFEGNGPGDPLFVQMKEEPGSAYAPYLARSAGVQHHGRRVAEGQRAMQLQSDPFLGWTTIDGRDYLVRQLNDHKATVKVATLKSRALLEYARLCGELLARGHARSGDVLVLAGYLGRSARFDEAVTAFAAEYAKQTEKDWAQFRNWLKRKEKNPAGAKDSPQSSKSQPADALLRSHRK